MAQAFLGGLNPADLAATLGPVSGVLDLEKYAARKAWDKAHEFKNKSEFGGYVKDKVEWLGDALIDLVVEVLEPIRGVFADLAAHYVKDFAGEMAGGRPDAIATGRGVTAGTTAAGAFDGICAPLGFMGGGNPEEPGAGHAAVQKTLGTLISLHLNTWVVNVISNLTGLGFLHYINSFDDVILSAMNTRSMGRLAFRPYMETYMVAPLTRDLNVAHPLKDTGPGTIVKAYTQGHITYTDFLQRMREKGYAAEIAATYVTEVQKHPSHGDVAWLVNTGVWSEQQGQAQLEAEGYDSSISQPVLLRAMFAGSETIARSIADEVVDEYAHWLIDQEPAQQIIIELGFPKFEQDLYFQLMELKHHRPIRPPYAQVRALYQASMVDLEYVTEWLQAEHYTPDDARAIILMDFATAATRSAHEAQLGAMYRLRSVTYQQKAAADLAKANQAKADAESRLASKYGALAARYGG
jgi:hypothetical protein